MTSLRSPFALVAAAVPAASCTLFCGFDGVRQPCDASGRCLSGYACVGGLCEPGDGGAGAGCTDDAACLPAGACTAGACETLPVAWQDGSPLVPSVACLPWPGPAAAGDPTVTLHGCLVSPPGGTPAQAVGARLRIFEKGFALGDSVPIAADADCPGGFGYQVAAPAGQILDAVVVGGDGTTSHDAAVRLDPVAEADGGRRDLVAWSASDAAPALAALGTSAPSALVEGVVRDCAGRPLSGVTVAPGGGLDVIAIAYLDATGSREPGRIATGSAGLFAVAVSPSEGNLVFTAAGPAGPQAIASLAVAVGPSDVVWIDVAPEGP